MKKNIKFVLSIIASLIVCMLFMECNVFATPKVINSSQINHVKKIVGFNETEEGTYYYGEDGQKVVSKFIKHDGDKYYFGKDGKMAKSKWIRTKSNKYFARSNGKIATGKVKIGGIVYNFDKSGKLISSVHEPLSYNNLEWGMSEEDVKGKLDELSREYEKSKSSSVIATVDVSKREADCVIGYVYDFDENGNITVFAKISISEDKTKDIEQFIAELESADFKQIGDKNESDKYTGYLFYNKETVEFVALMYANDVDISIMAVYDPSKSEELIDSATDGMMSIDTFNKFV